jgi:hypothetical protein
LAPNRACIVGIGQTEFAFRGQLAHRGTLSLAVEAILAAAGDAGLPVEVIDGFASFSEDKHDGRVLAFELGIPNLRYSALAWYGGRSNAMRRPRSPAMRCSQVQRNSRRLARDRDGQHTPLRLQPRATCTTSIAQSATNASKDACEDAATEMRPPFPSRAGGGSSLKPKGLVLRGLSAACAWLICAGATKPNAWGVIRLRWT